METGQPFGLTGLQIFKVEQVHDGCFYLVKHTLNFVNIQILVRLIQK